MSKHYKNLKALHLANEIEAAVKARKWRLNMDTVRSHDDCGCVGGFIMHFHPEYRYNFLAAIENYLGVTESEADRIGYSFPGSPSARQVIDMLHHLAETGEVVWE